MFGTLELYRPAIMEDELVPNEPRQSLMVEPGDTPMEALIKSVMASSPDIQRRAIPTQKKQTKKPRQIGLYTIGAFVGEEWICNKRWVERMENCMAKERSSVLEISQESYRQIRKDILDNQLKDDLYVLDSLIKKSYGIKKA